MSEWTKERKQTVVERLSRKSPIVRKKRRNWGPLGGHTLSASVPFLGVIFSLFPSFFGLRKQKENR
jgi:hypothetical protein